MFKRVIIFLTALLIISACEDSNNSEFQDINKWVYDGLYDYYFWYDKIDNHVIPRSITPDEYFYSLLYTEEDKWSYITDDYVSLNGELQGEPVSMGYSPAFGKISGSDDVFMIIEYVYPNSPAYSADLQRGDIITMINGEQMNTTNYYDLFQANSQVLTLAEFVDGSIQTTNTSIRMEAQLIQVNPVLFDTVYEQNGIKVGYCVITEFISTETFKEDVGKVLIDLNSKGISELIVDLRYNRGGYMNSAQWLASAIAPSNVVNNEEVLTKVVYNNKVEGYIPEDERTIYFVENDVNLDLSKVYFLTTSSSASASELAIIGLEPYMDVVLIGENTYGKYTGSWVIPDFNEPPQHNWAMMPIVLKYSNADGLTDFVDGLAPDYFIEEDLYAAVPFGDITDPLLNQALALSIGITGPPLLKSKPTQFESVFIRSHEQLLRMNLIFEN